MDVIKRDLGGNIIRDCSVAAGEGDAPGDATGAAGGGAADDATAKGPATAADGANGKKREHDDSRVKDETPSKKGKATKLTEAGVQQELIRYGGRMRTRELLRKLKRLIATDNDKALLKDILRTICDVEVDAVDGRLLVLKSQFRYM